MDSRLVQVSGALSCTAAPSWSSTPRHYIARATQRVDYVHRSFVSEYRALGFPDPGQRLRMRIAETAYKFSLGADWMNDHADVTLPWALECAVTLIPLSQTRFS